MLISEEWRQKNADFHLSCPVFGSKAYKRLRATKALIEETGSDSVLDYGCGKGGLVDSLKAEGIAVQGYDPCVERYAGMPGPADLIVFFEGFEHVEESCVDDVLAHIKSLTIKAAWLVTALREGGDVFPDGKNAHICVQNAEWWLSKFKAQFPQVKARQSKKDILDVLCLTR